MTHADHMRGSVHEARSLLALQCTVREQAAALQPSMAQSPKLRACLAKSARSCASAAA